MSGEIILEYWRVGRYGPDGNQDHLFFLLNRKKLINVIGIKVASIMMDSQFIYDVASDDGVKRRLVA